MKHVRSAGLGLDVCGVTSLAVEARLKKWGMGRGPCAPNGHQADTAKSQTQKATRGWLLTY